MIRFDDYHRTIIGYHGTRLSVAMDIINRRREFKFSRNRDDWLGHGVYFWEYAPQQAFWWAERRSRRQRWDEPIAILGSMIRLGFCFDLLDPYNARYLKEIHEEYQQIEIAAGRKVPQNANHHKYLDCAVFQYAYTAIEKDDIGRFVDTARAVYVPTGDEKRVWTRSWISAGAHIQLCVRNPACILGTWLHSPILTGGSDVNETTEIAKVDIQPENPTRGQAIEGDVDGRSHPVDGPGGTDDPGRGRSGQA